MLGGLFTILGVLSFVNGHSWVRCTMYNAEITGRDYSEDECEGWIRGWGFDDITFAQDRGINYQVALGGGQDLCQKPITDPLSASSSKIPTYVVGSTIRVVWPAKNHANYECFNFIPDTSMKLYMNPSANPTADIANDDNTMSAQGYTLVKDWQQDCNAGSDGCGFQNCPKFCEATDAATCYGDFQVPTVTTSGIYTFVWYWIFNENTAPYISCWEAYVETDGTTSAPLDESEGSESDSGSINGYIVQMPICIDGQDYDSSTVQDFVFEEFSDINEDDIEIIQVLQETNAYNFTAQFSVSSNEVSSITDTAADFCDNFEDEYTSTTCERCSDTVTYALYKNSSSSINYLSAVIIATFVSFWIL